MMKSTVCNHQCHAFLLLLLGVAAVALSILLLDDDYASLLPVIAAAAAVEPAETETDNTRKDEEEAGNQGTAQGAAAASAEEEDLNTKDTTSFPDYLIIGAGGSGIQTALLLEKLGRSYEILEKSSQVGNFWLQYPRFRELISVNKWVRNSTQRMRYDWHTMLETPLHFRDVTSSEDYFPKADDYQFYMEQIVKRSNLKISFGMEVLQLMTDDKPCVIMNDANRTKRCARHRIFVGTGLKEKKQPFLEALGAIPYSKATKQLAYHRRVCILGNGNSGFEIAQNVHHVADRVTMYGRHPHRFSAITRYTGDVRLKSAQVLENFNGKLLDTVDHFEQRPIIKVPPSWNISDSRMETLRDTLEAASFLNQHQCEVLFYATGFESYVPGLDLNKEEDDDDDDEGSSQRRSRRRFPATNDWYAWKENSNIHFIGWLMHEDDYRKGSGGFFSGFRYLIRNLIHHVDEEDFAVPYPHKVLTSQQEVVDHALARTQIADDLIILQDAIAIKDVVVKITKKKDGNDDKDDDEDYNYYKYYEGINYNFPHKGILFDDSKEEQEQEMMMGLYFAWGDGRRASTVFEDVIRYTDTGLLLNYLLHPVIEAPNGKGVRNIQEDTEMAWTGPSFEKAIVRVTEEVLDKNYTVFQPKKHFPYVRDVKNFHNNNNNNDKKGEKQRDYESCGVLPQIDKTVGSLIMKAGRFNTDESLTKLRTATSQWLPHLVTLLDE